MGDGSTHADDPEAWRKRTGPSYRIPPGPTPPDLEAVMRRQRGARLEIFPDDGPSMALTNVATYPAAYRICSAHEGGYFVTIESAGPPRLFGQVVFAGNLDDYLAYLGRKLSPGDSATTEETLS